MFFILEGQTVLAAASPEAWTLWMAEHERQVAMSELFGATVSTVFLGINHNFTGHGDPLVFETLVFLESGAYGHMARYFTWAEAEAGHREIVRGVTAEIERAERVSIDTLAAVFKAASRDTREWLPDLGSNQGPTD